MSRNDIRGVLDNFLGTYTSRYTEYDGYWLFGLLVTDSKEISIDLLAPIKGMEEKTPMAVASRVAGEKFREQMEKAGLGLDWVKEATLRMVVLPGASQGLVNGRMSAGHTFQFQAVATSNNGKVYDRNILKFIAPHDPKIECQSHPPQIG